MTPTNEPALGATKYLIRKYSNGDHELILCIVGKPLRFFASDEDEVFRRAVKYLSTVHR